MKCNTRRDAQKILSQALKQIRKRDFRKTTSLKTVVALTLEKQPEIAALLEEITPPQTDFIDFVVEGLSSGYFEYEETDENLNLKVLEEVCY